MAVTLGADTLSASGVMIGSDPEPYRLDYRLETETDFVSRRFSGRAEGDGWTRTLELTRSSASAGWSTRSKATGSLELPDAGGDPAAIAEARALDLASSPLFNTMPVLRHRLHEAAGGRDFLMGWIAVPALSFHASRQRYTHLAVRSANERVVRFETLDSDFRADVVFDADGLVASYPGIAERLIRRSVV